MLDSHCPKLRGHEVVMRHQGGGIVAEVTGSDEPWRKPGSPGLQALHYFGAGSKPYLAKMVLAAGEDRNLTKSAAPS